VDSLLGEACEWAASLSLDDIPEDVRRLAVAQALSAAGSRAATRRHPIAARLVPAIEGRGWASRAAADALLTMALDFDETAFAGHLGHAATAVALRTAEEVGETGERALVAMVAASEVAARLTASVTLGPARGQTASHTHSTAAVIAAGLVLGLPVGQLTSALALALAQPRQVLRAAFMGSDAKHWVAAAPILDAARALELARRGGSGLASILDVPGGVFETLADIPLPQAFGGYGTRWHLRTLSIKAIPGCAYLTAAVEAAASIGPLDLEEVQAVRVQASIFTVAMEAESAPFINGSLSPLPALSFSTGYNLASALESGGLDVDDLHGARLDRPGRWRVAGATRVEPDADLTIAALAATAPLGAALAWAGPGAAEYLAGRGATPRVAALVLERAAAEADPDLARSTKCLGARVSVTRRDGSLLEAFAEAASGSCQEPAEARLALAREKLHGQLLASDADRAAAAARVTAYEGLAGLDAASLAMLVGQG
jgi:2-methylcitrate dehydratase PrpD